MEKLVNLGGYWISRQRGRWTSTAMGWVAGKDIMSDRVEVPSSAGREMAVGIWGYLSAEYSLPHGVVRTALRPELAPLPGHT